MFDWNDEELRSMLWGETAESNNHIDLYPEKFDFTPEASPGDLQINGTSERNSYIRTFEMNKSMIISKHGYDLEQDSLCTDASNNLQKCSMNISLQNERSNKSTEDGEESDSFFYGLANIGCFDDLDKIFSNSDSIFGGLEDVNAEDLWSSAEDITSLHLEFPPFSGETSDVPQGNKWSSCSQASSGYRKINTISHKAPLDLQSLVTEGKIEGSHKKLNDRSAANFKQTPVKANRKGRLMKDQKSNKKNDVTLQHDSCMSTISCNSSQQVNCHFVSSVLSQQTPAVESPRRLSGSHLPTPLYGSVLSHHPAPSILASSGYEDPLTNAICTKNPENTSSNRNPMTPKEKIEKLQRRQQMRAILAIQKQKQQFNNQNSAFENGKVAAAGQGTCRNISMASGQCSVEESVLYQLQDAINKLDMGVRLTIRDSLFRLAKSATQRQNPNDTNSTCASTRDEPHSINSKDMISIQRFPRETKTNPIDRTVAHLMFHKPVEYSVNEAETSESLKRTGNAVYFQGATSSHSIHS